jgi:hypothetical protein
VNIDMTAQRGYRSALSACPQPAAVAAAGPAEARLRAVVVRPHVDAVAAPDQGTGLPAAVKAQATGLPTAGRTVADVPAMTLVQFVQPHPGDRALRPPV